jgi:nicotinate phosphoribosyltransferase
VCSPNVASIHIHHPQRELAAFTAYALAFPSKFLALIDTYDTLYSGLPNYVAVALALSRVGYTAVGGWSEGGLEVIAGI